MKLAKYFGRILATTALAATYPLIVFLAQDRLLFKPNKQNPVGAAPLPTKLRDAFVKTTDRLYLRGKYSEGDNSKPAILFNHGQSYNVDLLGFIMKPYIDANFPVFMTSYRAYGGNPGKYSEQGFIKDVAAGWEFLKFLGHEKIILHGHSMGCAHTAKFAATLMSHAVILEAPFESLRSATKAASKAPFASDLLKYEMNIAEAAKKITAPALVLHGGNDKKVPIEQGKKVFNSLKSDNKEFIEMTEADHYLYNHGSAQKIISWLSSRGLDRVS